MGELINLKRWLLQVSSSSFRHVSRTMRETEAEAVTFVVSHAIGLNGAEASTSNIQLWNVDKADTDRIAAVHSRDGFSDSHRNLSWRLTRISERKAFGHISSFPACSPNARVNPRANQ